MPMLRDMSDARAAVNGYGGRADSPNDISPEPEELDAVVVGAG